MLSQVGSGSPDNGLGKQPYLSGAPNCDQAGYHAATQKCDCADPAYVVTKFALQLLDGTSRGRGLKIEVFRLSLLLRDFSA